MATGRSDLGSTNVELCRVHYLTFLAHSNVHEVPYVEIMFYKLFIKKESFMNRVFHIINIKNQVIANALFELFWDIQMKLFKCNTL